MLTDLKTLTRPETLSGLESAKTTAKGEVRASQKVERLLLGSSAALLILVATLTYFFSRSRPIESIAVMPFVNACGDADIEYLSDGKTQTLIGRFSQ